MVRPLEPPLLPMTYAYDALSRAAASSTVTAPVWRDAVILRRDALSLALGAATLRRRTATCHPSIGTVPGPGPPPVPATADRREPAQLEPALYGYTNVAEEGGFELGRFPAVGAWLVRVAAQPGHIPIDG